METLTIFLAGALITIATYLMLSRTIVRVIVGTSALTHAGHLLLMVMGGFQGTSVPIIGEQTGSYVDALPQALILTSIVINFGVTAFFLVLAYRTYGVFGTDDLYELRGLRNE